MERLCYFSCQPLLPELFSPHTVNHLWVAYHHSLQWDSHYGSAIQVGLSYSFSPVLLLGVPLPQQFLVRPHRSLRPTYINQLVNFPITGN